MKRVNLGKQLLVKNQSNNFLLQDYINLETQLNLISLCEITRNYHGMLKSLYQTHISNSFLPSYFKEAI